MKTENQALIDEQEIPERASADENPGSTVLVAGFANTAIPEESEGPQESNVELEPEAGQPPVRSQVRTKKPSKNVKDPLGVKGFSFMVGGFVYSVYHVRNRRRYAVKCLGEAVIDG